MKGRPPDEFAAVPDGHEGEPMLFSCCQESYELYLNWLAEYLYRPNPSEAALSFDEAWSLVARVESRIASWFWEHPLETYPPGLEEGDPEHADFIHRVELSAALSRVHNHEDRFRLLNQFYRELDIDGRK